MPAGYTLVEKKEDVPQHLRSLVESLPSDPFPFVYPNDSTRAEQSLDAGQNEEAKYHGSRHRRARRARDQKTASSKGERIPKWFYKSNVALLQPSEAQKRSVIAVSQLPDGTYAQAAADADQGQVQVNQSDIVAPQVTEEKKQSWAKGRQGPPSDSGDGPKSPLPVPTSYITNTKSLSDGRYFVELAQYQELVNTFKGRFQSSARAATSGSRDPLAMNHLTILHGAPDSELLLNELVLDLCGIAGADRVRLDVQDMAELLAKAETNDDIQEQGGRLSFKLYQNLYGPNDYQESIFSRQEEENDEDDDDEHQPMTGHGIAIPVSSFMSPRDSKNIFERLGLAPGGRFTGRVSEDSPNMFQKWDKDLGWYNPLIESLLSSNTQARKMTNTQTSEATDEHKETEVPSPRPLVVHLENYRLLQDHFLTEAFMASLVQAADKRRTQGQLVMIIGTDSLRSDYQKSSPPRSLLDVQEKRSYGASTAVVLTPVFPNRDAELALAEDRKTRIRNINARHLHQVLKSKGVFLHGLEDGFWNKDYKAEMGDRDYEAVTGDFWPFVHIQRVAALIAGMQSTTPIEEACQIITNSDESKVAWAQRNQPDLAKSEQVQKKDGQSQQKSSRSRLKSLATTRHEKKLISGVVEPDNINTTFNDIHIPTETVETLKMLTTLSLQRPEAFRYGVLKSDRIPGLLLYGPPGTGKTLAAKAVAKESGATMLEVSAADLNDMYVGEGEKNVQALFSLAKKLSPCVVFLDEADAMFSARSTGKRVSHRELLNQFLKEWDGMSNDSTSAFIMVATNRPMDLDDAVLRRLPRRLLVDLPTEQDRLKILQIHLRNEEVASDVNLPDLAKKTPFYSGSDLKNVAVAAALNAVREENEAAAHYRTSNPTSETAYEYPEKRTLKVSHFEKALEEISASISEDMSSLREIKKFDEQYGDRRGRKKKGKGWGFKDAKDIEADRRRDTVKVRS